MPLAPMHLRKSKPKQRTLFDPNMNPIPEPVRKAPPPLSPSSSSPSLSPSSSPSLSLSSSSRPPSYSPASSSRWSSTSSSSSSSYPSSSSSSTSSFSSSSSSSSSSLSSYSSLMSSGWNPYDEDDFEPVFVDSYADLVASPDPLSCSLTVPDDFKADAQRLKAHWQRLGLDVSQYLINANDCVMDRLIAFNHEWGFEEFDEEVYYPSTQKLVFTNRPSTKAAFSKISCQGQVLGTYLPTEHAFIWSWADEGFSEQTSAAARYLYNFASKERESRPNRLFTDPLIECPDDLANLLCTAVCEMMNYDGVFRLTTERRGQLFVAFNVRMKEAKSIRPE